MVLQTKPVTMNEFLEYVDLPENSDRLFELINGEIIEVSPGRTYNSGLPHLLSFEVRTFCVANNRPCYISGSDGAYRIGNNTVAPDFGYKPTPLSKDYPDPAPPLWAVEVISPTDKLYEIRNKRAIYLKAGILLWELYEPSESIDVYDPNKPFREMGIDDILDGGDVLPGFQLAVKKLFGK